jgi:hypothetical protein
MALGILIGVWAMYGCFFQYLGDVVANWRLKLLKAEAAANPIETLENESLRRHSIAEEKKQQVIRFDAKVNTFKGKCMQFKRDFPDEAPAYFDILGKMQSALATMRNQYQVYMRALADYDNVIIKAKAKWQMALAVKDATADMASLQEDFMAKLKVDTSLDTIEDSMNQAEAQMDSLMLDNENVEDPKSTTKALPAPHEQITIMDSRSSKERVRDN